MAGPTHKRGEVGQEIAELYREVFNLLGTEMQKSIFFSKTAEKLAKMEDSYLVLASLRIYKNYLENSKDIAKSFDDALYADSVLEKLYWLSEMKHKDSITAVSKEDLYKFADAVYCLAAVEGERENLKTMIKTIDEEISQYHKRLMQFKAYAAGEFGEFREEHLEEERRKAKYGAAKLKAMIDLLAAYAKSYNKD